MSRFFGRPTDLIEELIDLVRRDALILHEVVLDGEEVLGPADRVLLHTSSGEIILYRETAADTNLNLATDKKKSSRSFRF
jgi:hypothetical protein